MAEGCGGCRQQDQRELRRQRKRLRELCGADAAEGLLEAEDTEELCRELGREQLSTLCDAVDEAADEDAQRAALEAALNQMYEARGEVRARSRACMRVSVAALHACPLFRCVRAHDLCIVEGTRGPAFLSLGVTV